MPTALPTLVLASTSRYRAKSLRRLQLLFESAAPNVDEAHRLGETPSLRATRLAQAKATALKSQFPHAVLIGSDQVAACDTEVFDKPGNQDNAVTMLMSQRGRCIEFHTAVCVHHAPSNTNIEHSDVTRVSVRSDLTQDDIVRYVAADQPLDCAGGFKVESLGIALFERVQTDDPTALIGLPLIGVAKALRTFGLSLIHI